MFFKKSGVALNGFDPGTSFSQLTRLAWLASGSPWTQEMGLESRLRPKAHESGYQWGNWLPLLCTGCGEHEREGGERAAALRGPGPEAGWAAEWAEAQVRADEAGPADPLPGEDQASWGSCFDVTVCVLPWECGSLPQQSHFWKFGFGDEGGGRGCSFQVLGWLSEGWGVGVLPAGNWRLGGWNPYKPLLPSQGILGLGGEGACLAGILFFLGRELVCEEPGWLHRWWETEERVLSLWSDHQCQGEGLGHTQGIRSSLPSSLALNTQPLPCLVAFRELVLLTCIFWSGNWVWPHWSLLFICISSGLEGKRVEI